MTNFLFCFITRHPCWWPPYPLWVPSLSALTIFLHRQGTFVPHLFITLQLDLIILRSNLWINYSPNIEHMPRHTINQYIIPGTYPSYLSLPPLCRTLSMRRFHPHFITYLDSQRSITYIVFNIIQRSSPLVSLYCLLWNRIWVNATSWRHIIPIDCLQG